jgi:hypothetical protein
MANQALARLESALRERKLDRTLTTALSALERRDASAPGAPEARQADTANQPRGESSRGRAPWLVPSHIDTLDALLHGGLPRGQLSELAGPATSGRTTLLLHIIAAITQRGELAALIDTCDCLDVASAAAAGVDMTRLLWIRGEAAPAAAGLRSTTLSLDRIIDRALKALNLVLQAGGFGVVAIDLADVPPVALKRLPFTTWLRVQRTIEASETACVLVVPEPLARSAGGLTLALAGRPMWAGTADRSRRLTGVDVGVRVISPRRRVEGETWIEAMVNEIR